MFRIRMIEEIIKQNKILDWQGSFEVLKSFIADESTEAYLAEECAFGRHKDEIACHKHLVDRINHIKIEVYSKEHVPPHFHIHIAEYEGSYTIDNCEKLTGNIMRKHEKKIIIRHKNGGKEKLIEKWNTTRPENCPVGKI